MVTLAIGDAAAAKGYITVPPTKNHGLGYSDINQAMDYVAAEVDARAAAVTAEAAARLAADNALTTAKLDANKIIISSGTPAVVTGGVWFRPV